MFFICNKINSERKKVTLKNDMKIVFFLKCKI